MPRPRRWMAAHLVTPVAVLAAVVLGTAGSAAAGGPTSVLLVSPDRGVTASLYRSDPTYTQLQSLLGLEGPGSTPRAEAGGQHGMGPYVTVTWLIHDIKVWRVNRIYVEAPGGPWISTQLVMTFGGTPAPGATAEPDIGPTLPIPATWHPAPEPAKLIDLLDDLDLLAPCATVPPREPADTGVAAAPAPPPATAAGPDGDGYGWWWGLGGIAAGILLGAAATRFAAGRMPIPRRHGTDPRQQLLDT